MSSLVICTSLLLKRIPKLKSSIHSIISPSLPAPARSTSNGYIVSTERPVRGGEPRRSGGPSCDQICALPPLTPVESSEARITAPGNLVGEPMQSHRDSEYYPNDSLGRLA